MQALVDSDLFKADKKTIDTQKVVFKIWENRNNIDVVKELADLISQFTEEQRVFKDIEFYLPQLAHLIIHLDVDSKTQSLERFAMVLCQNSVHTALQLSFLFSAALEDYQPETIHGQRNPECNPFFFKRCARLLQDVERAVIYGSQNLSNKEEKVLKRRMTAQLESGLDSKQIEAELIDAKRLEVANALSRNTQIENYDGLINEPLMYKRVDRKSIFSFKPWKQRHFQVDQRVLLCFREPHSVNPLRTIPLAACHVEVIEKDPKYGETRFDVINYSNNCRFQLMAKDKDQRNKWVTLLRSEILGAPMVVIEGTERGEEDANGVASVKKTFAPIITENDMSAIQKKRFNYFKQMRIFLTNICNICERLRFKERPVRKYFLRRDMKDLLLPPFGYLPLTSSLEPFQQILRTLPTEAHAFSTKARCPALMLFEVETHPRGVDVSTFLCSELERYDESVVINHDVQIKNGSSTTWVNEEENLANESEDRHNAPHLNSVLGQETAQAAIWKPEGTGLTRLEAMGIKFNQRPSLSGNSNAELKADIAEAVSPATGTTASSQLSESTYNVVMPPTLIGETFQEKAQRLKAKSPYGHLPGWKLGGLIAKSNDDVRQEVFVMQLIKYYQNAFREANLPVWLLTYTILSTSQSTGLIELIPNSISLDGLKKKEGYPGSLRAYFETTYGYQQGGPETHAFRAAMDNYVSSMAGYSIVTYLLGIKDRHNGNVMIDNVGHIIHIDFGFVFGLAPGKAFSMERAPWKLTKEMVDVMGGLKSADFESYTKQCVQAFLVARKHAKQVKALIEIMNFHSSYPCFRYNAHALADLTSRLMLELPDQSVEAAVKNLIHASYNHTGTGLYDQFQLATNGIAI